MQCSGNLAKDADERYVSESILCQLHQLQVPGWVQRGKKKTQMQLSHLSEQSPCICISLYLSPGELDLASPKSQRPSRSHSQTQGLFPLATLPGGIKMEEDTFYFLFNLLQWEIASIYCSRWCSHSPLLSLSDFSHSSNGQVDKSTRAQTHLTGTVANL